MPSAASPRFEYDNLNRLIRRTLPAGQSESFEYGALGNLAAHTHFNGGVTRLTPTMPLNRRVLQTRPDGSRLGTAYTATSQVGSQDGPQVRPGTPTIAGDRLTRAGKPTGRDSIRLRRSWQTAYTSAQTSGNTRYIYNAQHQLDKVIDPQGLETGL